MLRLRGGRKPERGRSGYEGGSGAGCSGHVGEGEGRLEASAPSPRVLGLSFVPGALASSRHLLRLPVVRADGEWPMRTRQRE